MENNNPLSTFFYGLPQNIGTVFRGKNLLWQALAMGLTFIFVVSGFDWAYYKATQIPSLQAILFPAVILGFILPVIAPVALLIWGMVTKNLRLLNAAFALGQAAALGWALSAFYKTFTGRLGPGEAAGNISKVFRFGFLRGGVFWGWPSSHTTVALSMSMALYSLYPENKFIKCLAVVYALYITISVSMTIHWFSDCVAGVIFGSLVGFAVGKSFFQRYKAIKSA